MADPKPPEQANSEPSRLRRWWRRFYRGVAWLTLVLLVLAVVYVLWANAAGRRDAQRVLEAMRQRDLPTTYKELLATLPPLPPGEDGTRYYLAAMALASIPQDEATGIPFISTGRDIYPQRGEAIKDEQAKRLRAFVQRNAAFYAMSDTALGYRCGGYGTRAANGVMEMHIGAFANARRVARLLQVRSLERTAGGDADGAIVAMRDVFAWSGSLGRDPSVVGALVRVSLIALASAELEDIISRVGPSAEALRAFRHALRDECDAARDLIALRGDFVLTAEALLHPKLVSVRNITYTEQFIATDPYAGMRAMFQDFNGAIPDAFAGMMEPPNARIRLWCDVVRIWSTICPGAYQSSYAEGMESLLEAYDAWDADPDGYVQAMIERGAAKDDPLSGVVNAVTLATLHRAVTSAAIDVEVYRIEHGAWPETLAALPGGEPDDPLGDGPLRYKRVADGVIVYSVGRNRRDDGGEQDGIVVQDGDAAFRLFDPGVRGTIEPVGEEAGDEAWGFGDG